MDDFERAVLLSLDPTAGNGLYGEATAFVAKVESAPDGWRFCLERLGRDGYRSETRFWCLEVINRAVRRGAVGAADMNVVRAGGASFLMALAAEQYSVEAYVMHKAAQLFATVLDLDYPQTWPGAFQEVVLPLAAAPAAGPEAYFAVLQAVDEDLTSKRAADTDAARAMRVKDAMREDCIPQITAALGTFLQSDSRRLVALALDTIRRYVEWVDIGLIVTPQLVEVVHRLLGRNENSTGSPLVSSAAAAMRAVIGKRMPVAQKLKLMQFVRVNELLGAVMFHHGRFADAADPEEVDLQLGHPALECAKLVNQVAMEAIECLKEPSCAGPAVIVAEAALPAALRLVDDDNDADVTAETMEFINVYIRLSRGNVEANTAGLTAILHVIVDRACFPEDLDPLDASSTFKSLRDKLFTLFQNIARIAPSLGLATVRGLIEKEGHGDARKPARAELVYSLANLCLLVLANAEQELPASQLDDVLRVVLSSPFRCVQVETVGTEGYIAEAHRSCALLALFTLAYQSHKLIEAAGDLLVALLGAFYDKRGLQHPLFPAHRSKTAGLLLKFFLKLRGPIAARHLSQAVTATMMHLRPESPLEAKDRLTLYEALGVVVGFKHPTAETERAENLRLILEPINDTLRTATKSRNMAAGLQAVAAASNIAKGFSSEFQEKSEAGQIISRLWRTCLDTVWEFYSAFQGEPEASARVMVFIQTAVGTVGETAVAFAGHAVPLLLQNVQSARDVTRILEIVNQIASQFRELSLAVMTAMFVPITRKVFEFSVEESDGVSLSEEMREAQELHKFYLSLLTTLVTKNLQQVLTAPPNLPVLEQVVGEALQGASGKLFDANSQPNTMKLCYQLLARLVTLWVGPGSLELDGFRQFAIERVSEACISGLLESTYLRRSGYRTQAAEKIVYENLVLQKTCVERCGVDFGTQMATKVLPALGCPAEVAQEYCQHLLTDEAKQLLRPFEVLIGQLRQKIGQTT